MMTNTLNTLWLNLIFWDMMGCGIAHFGRGVWKPLKLTKFGLKLCSLGFGLAAPGAVSRDPKEKNCELSL